MVYPFHRWFDCQAASRKLKRKPVKKAGSLVAESQKAVFIGNGDNDLPVASAVRMGPNGEELNDWGMHGDSPDHLTSNGTELDQCKLLLVLFPVLLKGLFGLLVSSH